MEGGFRLPVRTAQGRGNGQGGAPALSTVLRRIDSGGFVFREHHAAPGQKNPRHAHEYDCIGFVFAGEGAGEIGGECWRCRSGMLNVVPAGTAHDESCGPSGLQWCGIELPRVPDAIQAQARWAFPRPYQVGGGEAISIARRILIELRIDDVCSPLALHGLGLELLATLARTGQVERTPPPWLARVLEYARTHFANAVHMETLAAEAGVHHLHLARTFRKHVGCTVGEYLRTQRLEAAIALLKDGGSLSGVAQLAGFCDQAHFTRTFKRHTGMTPTQYRRLHSN